MLYVYALRGTGGHPTGGALPEPHTVTSSLQQATGVHVSDLTDSLRKKGPVLTDQQRAAPVAFVREYQDWQVRRWFIMFVLNKHDMGRIQRFLFIRSLYSFKSACLQTAKDSRAHCMVCWYDRFVSSVKF